MNGRSIGEIAHKDGIIVVVGRQSGAEHGAGTGRGDRSSGRFPLEFVVREGRWIVGDRELKGIVDLTCDDR